MKIKKTSLIETKFVLNDTSTIRNILFLIQISILIRFNFYPERRTNKIVRFCRHKKPGVPRTYKICFKLCSAQARVSEVNSFIPFQQMTATIAQRFQRCSAQYRRSPVVRREYACRRQASTCASRIFPIH